MFRFVPGFASLQEAVSAEVISLEISSRNTTGFQSFRSTTEVSRAAQRICQASLIPFIAA
jgi:hypothetical protein